MSRQLAFGDSGALEPADLRALVGVDLSPAQLDAATAPLEPGVIVAGAGSGKTTVMAARVVWLVATGAVAPHEVLGLTFTTKAAASLASRVRLALRRPGVLPEGDDDPGEPVVSTYHAFAARLLVEHGVRLGVEPTSRLLTDASRYQLAHRVVCRPAQPFLALDESPAALVKKVLDLDDALAEHGVSPAALQAWDADLVARLLAAPVQQRAGADMIATARRRIDLARLVAAFRMAKLDRDVHDFADQTRLAAQLATAHPAVGAALREQARVVLLDEYQDTSTAQRHLLAALFGEGHPVTAVGDPCQAIYGWRGASVHNIDAFPQHFPVVAPDGARRPARRYTLVENRRSGPVILDVANDLARRLREEHPGVGPLVPGTAAKGSGVVRCALLETVDDEVAWVAERVAAQRGVVARWDEVAVLCRTTAEFGALKRALEARGVPVEVVGTAGLLALPEVVEIVSVLRVLHDPTANPSFVRLLTGPRWRLGPRDLAALGAYAEGLVSGRRPRGEERRSLDEELDDAVVGADPTELVSLSDAVLHLAADVPVSEQARERLGALGRELRGLRRHVGEPLVDLVHRVLAVTGLDVEIAAVPGGVAGGAREAVEAFLDLVSGFRDADGERTLGALLRWLDDAERFDASPAAEGPSGRDAVMLMTVHKAKGLEFPVVVLPFLGDDDFPLKRTQELWVGTPTAVPHGVRDEPVPPALAGFPPEDGPRARDLDAVKEAWKDLHALEEIRLGYVAVTRAERLLLASASFWTRSAKAPRRPGPFLLAVREAALGGAGQVDEWAEVPEEGAVNPLQAQAASTDWVWPVPLDPTALAARRAAADDVRAAMARLEALGRPGRLPAADGALAPAAGGTDDLLTAAMAALGDDPGVPEAADWDADLRLVLAALAADEPDEVVVALPESLSASALMALADDPDAFLADLVRPMPRRPSAAASRGTRFHAWVEARSGQQPMLDPDDLPGAADDDLDDGVDLADLQAGFERTPYAALVPVVVEAPFAVVLGGRVVRGRIDAVFRHEVPARDGSTAVRWEVVDWKTGRAGTADPLQLAVYRLAWAEAQGVPLDEVAATFVHVASSTIERHDGLPGREELEALLSGAGAPAGSEPRTPRA